MSVYVDDMHSTPMGQSGRMKFSHMLADTEDELHAMADKIGVSRRWHQSPPKHDSHYDIVKSKRALAVSFGAVEITLKQAACMCRRRRETGVLGSPDDAIAWRLARISPQ